MSLTSPQLVGAIPTTNTKKKKQKMGIEIQVYKLKAAEQL
jgi:predicted component of type VI protein secretion system